MRADRAKDNAEITPADLLRTALYDLEEGKAKWDGLLMLGVARQENGDLTFNVYRSNVSRSDELVLLEFAKLRHLERWNEGR